MSGKIKLGKQIHEIFVKNPSISLLKIDISIQGVFNNLNQSNMYINSIRFFFFLKIQKPDSDALYLVKENITIL